MYSDIIKPAFLSTFGLSRGFQYNNMDFLENARNECCTNNQSLNRPAKVNNSS